MKESQSTHLRGHQLMINVVTCVYSDFVHLSTVSCSYLLTMTSFMDIPWFKTNYFIRINLECWKRKLDRNLAIALQFSLDKYETENYPNKSRLRRTKRQIGKMKGMNQWQPFLHSYSYEKSSENILPSQIGKINYCTVFCFFKYE